MLERGDSIRGGVGSAFDLCVGCSNWEGRRVAWTPLVGRRWDYDCGGYREGLTVTRNFAMPVFALLSEAEHVTSVRPTMNRLPDLGVHDAVTAPSTASLAVTL